MAYDGKLLRLAQEAYERDRAARRAEQARTREAIFTRCPRLREVDRELHGTTGKILAAALRRGEDPTAEIYRLRDENLNLQAEKQNLLTDMGLPFDALDEKPTCPRCDDTGFAHGEVCDCLRAYYVREQTRDLSRLLDLGNQSFDTFSLGYYSDRVEGGRDKSERTHMAFVYDTCADYARSFGKRPANLLLFGAPGLGKTHLSAAIAREVSERGFSVVYDTAAHIFERMEALKFGRDEAAEDVRRVLACDLLILDDLGTEMTTAFVQSALYQIVDARLRDRLSTIVSTNLLPDELERRYSPQIASRLEGE
ncbi:MAG: ATP-binding protein [Oscillibacter sp.]|nr:ATP-binding protein [Oscillibacter sp.]